MFLNTDGCYIFYFHHSMDFNILELFYWKKSVGYVHVCVWTLVWVWGKIQKFTQMLIFFQTELESGSDLFIKIIFKSFAVNISKHEKSFTFPLCCCYDFWQIQYWLIWRQILWTSFGQILRRNLFHAQSLIVRSSLYVTPPPFILILIESLSFGKLLYQLFFTRCKWGGILLGSSFL